MKKIIFSFLILFIFYSLVYTEWPGDNFGNHKATRNINMNGHSLSGGTTLYVDVVITSRTPGVAGSVISYEIPANGDNFAGWGSPDSLTDDVTYKFPVSSPIVSSLIIFNTASENTSQTNFIPLSNLQDSTNTLRTDLDAVSASTGNFYTKIVSDSNYANKEAVQNSTTSLNANKINYTDVFYSTCSIYAQFIATSSVNIMDTSTFTVRIPFDVTPMNWYLAADSTGTATVIISTGMITGGGITYGTDFITMSITNVQTNMGTLTNGVIPRGYYIKFKIAAEPTTCRELYPSLEIWKR